MKKAKRIEVHQKFGGRCAYCGNPIEYKDMQVDHIYPKARKHMYEKQNPGASIDDMDNLHPACRRCNHYKRQASIRGFRMMMQTLHARVRDHYINKVAQDYGILVIKEWDGKFYFEREGDNDNTG